jgi:hypothetical protein
MKVLFVISARFCKFLLFQSLKNNITDTAPFLKLMINIFGTWPARCVIVKYIAIKTTTKNTFNYQTITLESRSDSITFAVFLTRKLVHEAIESILLSTFSGFDHGNVPLT